MTMDDRLLPLGRFTVLDLTRVRAGPTCVRQLADWGANVLKVELPESVEGNAALGGPRHGSDFQNLHRNKRSITLNLKEPEGLDLFKRLVAKADVVVENYPPGRQVPSRDRLCVSQSGQPWPGVREYLWFWRGRSVSAAPWLRPDCAGHGGADVDYGPLGTGARAPRRAAALPC
jgi:hypothetical protein